MAALVRLVAVQPTPRRPTAVHVLALLRRKRLCELGDAKAIEAIDRMAHYIGLGVAMLITGFAPSLIVVAAEVTRVWPRIEPIINRIVAEKCQQPSAT